MRFGNLVLVLSAVLICASSWAGPAAWYKWHSSESDIEICLQISPGEGWFVVKGPFEDAVCKKLGMPH